MEQQVRGQADDERDVVWRRRVGRLKRRSWKRRLLNGFIVWHLFAVAVWLLPLGGPILRYLVPPDGSGLVRAYITTAGLRQNWSMYAPNPSDQNISLEAKVWMRNGTIRTWVPARTRDMGYARRYQSERVHEWTQMTSGNVILWYPFARYVARRCSTDPHNPPVAVLLMQHTQIIPTPGQPAPPVTTSKLCFADVRKENLR